MVIAELANSGRDTRDNIAARDTTRTQPVKRNKEIIYEEENSTIGKTSTLGNAWIVGTSTNGIVGVNTGTQGGGQQVVGGDGRVSTIIRVVNPNNTFREHYRDTTFKDTTAGVPNTAVWDTTNFRLAMHSSSDHNRPYSTIATFKSIFLNSQTIISATVNATETRYQSKEKIGYLLSADGGSNWQDATPNVELFFTTTGTELKLKIIFIGQGGASTYIEDLQVSYVV